MIRPVRILVAAALSWLVIGSIWVFPHSLSYFNESVRGPMHGPDHLLGSNVDWGQDLIYVKRWMQKNPYATPFHVVYFGYFEPVHTGFVDGIRISSPRQDQKFTVSDLHGYVAISVNVRYFSMLPEQGDLVSFAGGQSLDAVLTKTPLAQTYAMVIYRY